MSTHQLTPSKQQAKSKAREALKCIEQAQRMLGRACEELSSITGLCDEWSKVSKMYDRVNELWHDVNLRSNADDYDMDSDHGGPRRTNQNNQS